MRTMTTITTHAFLAIVTVAAALHASPATAAPRIFEVTPGAPARGPGEQILTINGSGFKTGLALSITSPEGNTRSLSGSDIQLQRESSFQVATALTTSGS